MIKITKVLFVGLLISILSSCGDVQDAFAPEPSAEPLDNALNVEKVGNDWVVKSGDPEAAQLWRSQNPLGKTVTVKFADSSEPTQLVIKDGHAFIGDMLIGDVRGEQVIGAQGEPIANLDGSPLLRSQGFGIYKTGNKWPNAVIPYVFDSSATSNIRSQFEKARSIYTKETGIRLVKHTNQSQYVRVMAGSGCSSYVGRMSTSFKRNGQELKLGRDGCGVGAALHEIGHAAGLMHEQTRCDRDDYIRVRYDLIDPNWHSQYEKSCGSVHKSHTSYDYNSIMHYGNSRIGGQWQMTDRKGKVSPQDIGSDGVLTSADKTSFKAIYGKGGNDGGDDDGGTDDGGDDSDKEVCFYVRSNYRGTSFCANANDNWVGNTLNDRVTSVKVPKGYKVTLYQHINYGGKKKTISGNVSSLSDFNNILSSYKISK